MKDEIKKIIYNWVAKNFGESEADDPSWSIVELANELEKHFHELYWQQELDYLAEDVARYAEDNGIDLTEKQAFAVADKIRNSEWYCSLDTYMLGEYIKDEVKKGE